MKKLAMKFLKFSGIVSVAGLVAFMAVVVYATHRLSDLRDEYRAYMDRTAPGGMKHMRVADVDYDVPVGYFAGILPPYVVSADMYIKVFWPDFIVQPMSNDELMKQGKRDFVLRMLVDDPRFIRSLDGLAENSFKITHRSVLSGQKFGLDSYALPPGVDGKDSGEPFTRQEDGRYVTVIQCDNDVIKGSSPKSLRGCTHYFSDGYLLFRVSYIKSLHLEHWREIEEKTKALFAEFRRSAKEKGYDRIAVPDNFIDPYYKEHIDRPVNPDFKLPKGE